MRTAESSSSLSTNDEQWHACGAVQHHSERVNVPSLLSSVFASDGISAGYSMRIHNEARHSPAAWVTPAIRTRPRSQHRVAHFQNRGAVPLIHHVPTRFHFQEPRNSADAHATSNSPSYSAHEQIPETRTHQNSSSPKRGRYIATRTAGGLGKTSSSSADLKRGICISQRCTLIVVADL